MFCGTCICPMLRIQSPNLYECLNRLHIADRHTHFMWKFLVFEILAVKFLWPRFRMVQGQPKSKDTAPVNSAQVVSYSTSVDPSSYRIYHRFWNIWCQIFMTLNKEGSWSSGVKIHSVNRKPIFSFLSDGDRFWAPKNLGVLVQYFHSGWSS